MICLCHVSLYVSSIWHSCIHCMWVAANLYMTLDYYSTPSTCVPKSPYLPRIIHLMCCLELQQICVIGVCMMDDWIKDYMEICYLLLLIIFSSSYGLNKYLLFLLIYMICTWHCTWHMHCAWIILCMVTHSNSLVTNRKYYVTIRS